MGSPFSKAPFAVLNRKWGAMWGAGTPMGEENPIIFGRIPRATYRTGNVNEHDLAFVIRRIRFGPYAMMKNRGSCYYQYHGLGPDSTECIFSATRTVRRVLFVSG